MPSYRTFLPVLACVLAAQPPLWSQVPADTASGTPALLPLHTVGGPAADLGRVRELLGGGTPNSLLRSASASTPRLCCGTAPRAALVAPEAVLVWNSAIPFTENDGALWAGRGASTRLRVGAVLEAGPLRIVAAPELVHIANRPFEAVIPLDWLEEEPHAYQPPWQSGIHAADVPYRFGDRPLTEVHPGQSSVALHAGPLAIGAATENHWWGPGIRSAIVLSDNAPGFPHLFARSIAPLCTPLGTVEWRWLAGALAASPRPARAEEAGHGRRSLAAAGVTVAPRGVDGLTVGVARSVYASAERAGDVPGRFLDVLRHWDAGRVDGPDAEQILSFFGRWVVPGNGAEVYGEWARHELPASVRDALEMPQHTRGFTLGAQWAAPVRAGAVRLQAELTQLEQSPTYRARPIGSWYASARVPHGYTHRGQVLGSVVGPGGSGQWIGTDYLGPTARAGLFAGRIRWSTDAFYDSPQSFTRQRGYDVSLYGGARAGVRIAGMDVGGEWTMGKRYNYLFQSRATSWETRDKTVNVVNHTLRLSVSPLPGPARR